MCQKHLQGFLDDALSINPRINIDGKIGRPSSLLGLVAQLRNTVGTPRQITFDAAVQLCANRGQDPRVQKYHPAIGRLVKVWGRGPHLPYPPPRDPAKDQSAKAKFDQYVANINAALRPNYETDLHAYEENVFGFQDSLGRAYLEQKGAGANRVDITARSLLLKSGLGPPEAGEANSGYWDSLQLSANDLGNMRNKTILDVGCGGAIFGAEMEVLYNCKTTSVDLHSHEMSPGAKQDAKKRYVKSTLYLEMIYEKGLLWRTSLRPESVLILGDQARPLQSIIDAYQDNPPKQGDVFKLAEARTTHHRGESWDVIVCMYLLCYFDPGQQTQAVLSMCGVLKRPGSIFLHSGKSGRLLTPRLAYDQDAVRALRATIDVKDEATHHIHLTA